METREKLVVAILGLSLFLCWFSQQGGSYNPMPTPTAKAETGISPDRYALLLVQSYITATGDPLKYNVTTFWRSLESEVWKISPQGTDWIAELCFIADDKPACATWLYRPDTDFLEPLDYWGRFFFHNQAGF